MFLGATRRAHMVGIGGVGMSSIAEVLLSRGFEITGSDLEQSEVTDRLTKLGASISIGHKATHASGADVVVYSSAVDPDTNPETLEALHRRIPLIRRAEMLGELMRMKYGVGVAGTHGKTTTTSLIGTIVAHAGLDPTVVAGGKVTTTGAGARTGEGELIVVEADEYDRTFHRLTPVVAVITTIESEHLDTYKDLDEIKEAFVRFARSVPFFGAVIVCLDDPNVQDIIPQIDRRVITYGFSRQAGYRAENVLTDGLFTGFEAYEGVRRMGKVRLPLPGLHNVQNALAGIAVAGELNIPWSTVAGALDSFQGVKRRFEVKGEAAGIVVVDDYAHHPSEVAATLDAAAAAYPDRRIVAAFQPHLYSRTRDMCDAFGGAFFNADVVVIAGIYPAREAPLPGISGKLVADRAVSRGHKNVFYVEDRRDLATRLDGLVQEGDVVFLLGAGDIWRTADDLLNRLNQRQTDQ